MKQIILLLTLLLGYASFLPGKEKKNPENVLMGKQAGDTLFGQHVMYKVSMDSISYYVLQNTNNRDTANLSNPYPDRLIIPWEIPRAVERQVSELVGNYLTPKERIVYKRTNTSDLIVHCRLENNRIKELAFYIYDIHDYDGEIEPRFVDDYEKLRMLWSIPADRFYKIEKALKKLDFKGQEWIKEGNYVSFAVNMYYVQD